MAQAFQVHKNLIETRAISLARFFVPTRSVPKVSILVQSGLHKDSSIQFEKVQFDIGSSSESDLILLDDCVAEHHARVSVCRSIFGAAIQVTTQCESVALDASPIIPKQASPFKTIPATLDLGNVTLKFSNPNPAKHSRFLRWLERMFRSFVLLLFFLLAWLGVDVKFDAIGRPAAVAVVGLVQTDPVVETDKVDLAKQLTEKIKASKLSEYLSILQPSSSTIIVSGTLPSGKLGSWKTIHRWFDSQPNSPLLTANVQSAPVLSDFPAIGSVKLSDPPQVRFMNGVKATIGDTIHKKWKIKKISSGSLWITNGSETIELSF